MSLFGGASEPLCPYFKTPCKKAGCAIWTTFSEKEGDTIREVGKCPIPIVAVATIQGNDLTTSLIAAVNGLSKNVDVLRNENVATAPAMVLGIVEAMHQVAQKKRLP